MITFGAGVLFGTPSYDGTGAAIALPSPVQFGILQDVTVDESWETKMLHGAKQFPVAIGRGKGKVAMKAKVANFNAELVNTFLYGVTPTSAYENIYNDLTGSLVPTSPYTLTPTSSAVVADLGVVGAIDGVPFTRVGTASTPTGLQYSFDPSTPTAAAWTFGGVEQASRVYISYVYSAAASGALVGAKRIAVINEPMGVMPIFAVDFAVQYQGKTLYVRYPNCIASSFTRTYKNDDFTVPEFSIEAFADSSGVISYMYAYE